jgi:hypothetical protein
MSNLDQKILRAQERTAEALEKIAEGLEAIRWELKQRRLAKPKGGDNDV